jgi:hypothetical protein
MVTSLTTGIFQLHQNAMGVLSYMWSVIKDMFLYGTWLFNSSANLWSMDDTYSYFTEQGKFQRNQRLARVAQWRDVERAFALPHPCSLLLSSQPPGRQRVGKSHQEEGKATQEICTPPHQFSQIPFKLNPATRNNFSRGADPQMLGRWTLCFPHHKIIHDLTRQSLASGSPSHTRPRLADGSTDNTKHFAPVLASGENIFHRMGPDDVTMWWLARLQSFFLTSRWKLGTYAPEGYGDHGRTSSWFIKLAQI